MKFSTKGTKDEFYLVLYPDKIDDPEFFDIASVTREFPDLNDVLMYMSTAIRLKELPEEVVETIWDEFNPDGKTTKKWYLHKPRYDYGSFPVHLSVLDELGNEMIHSAESTIYIPIDMYWFRGYNGDLRRNVYWVKCKIPNTKDWLGSFSIHTLRKILTKIKRGVSFDLIDTGMIKRFFKKELDEDTANLIMCQLNEVILRREVIGGNIGPIRVSYRNFNHQPIVTHEGLSSADFHSYAQTAFDRSVDHSISDNGRNWKIRNRSTKDCSNRLMRKFKGMTPTISGVCQVIPFVDDQFAAIVNGEIDRVVFETEYIKRKLSTTEMCDYITDVLVLYYGNNRDNVLVSELVATVISWYNRTKRSSSTLYKNEYRTWLLSQAVNMLKFSPDINISCLLTEKFVSAKELKICQDLIRTYLPDPYIYQTWV